MEFKKFALNSILFLLFFAPIFIFADSYLPQPVILSSGRLETAADASGDPEYVKEIMAIIKSEKLDKLFPK